MDLQVPWTRTGVEPIFTSVTRFRLMYCQNLGVWLNKKDEATGRLYKGRADRPCLYICCVPSMFDSLGERVPLTT